MRVHNTHTRVDAGVGGVKCVFVVPGGQMRFVCKAFRTREKSSQITRVRGDV